MPCLFKGGSYVIFKPPLWKKRYIVLHRRSFCQPSDVRSISFDFFDWKGINFELWMHLQSRCSLLFFRTHGHRPGSNCRSLKKCCTLNISRLLCWKFAKLCTQDASRVYMTPVDAQVTRSKVKCKLLAFAQMLST